MRLLFTAFLALHSSVVPAQTAEEVVVIGQILLRGNDVTKDFVILRELPFEPGDSVLVSDLSKLQKQGEDLLMNTTLFKSVALQFDTLGGVADLIVTVSERWYIFPIPVLELADRNFNVWYRDFHHDLRRLVYGVNFYHNNLTGRADQLRLEIQSGFNQLLGIRYSLPFFSQKSRWGAAIGADWRRSRDVFYKDSASRQLFFKSDVIAQDLRRVYTTLSCRQNLYVSHLFHTAYFDSRVIDTIIDLNPLYFTSGQRQQYAMLAYEFIGDWRDSKAYPKRGARFQFLLRKNGVGIHDYNQAEGRILVEWHRNPKKNIILSAVGYGKMSLVRDQPYFNYRGLGFGNTLVRGYEHYVVNGQHFVLLQTSAKWRFLSFIIQKPIVSIKPLNNMPLDFYLKPHVDVGYVWDPFFAEGNPLSNAPLIGYGIGLDVVTYYDLVTSINYTINGLGGCGIYLHFNL
jgi:outer membrane protein assembly factor BamA